MAKSGKVKDRQARERKAAERAAQGQSAALGDTGDGQTSVERTQQGISNRPGDQPPERRGDSHENDGRPGGEDVEDVPVTEAGAPPLQEQQRSSLDSPSQSGRPRVEGDERIERTGTQDPLRSDPEAVRPPGSPGPGDNTM